MAEEARLVPAVGIDHRFRPCQLTSLAASCRNCAGGMNGLFAKLSMTELRSQAGVCSSECTTYHCLKASAPPTARVHTRSMPFKLCRVLPDARCMGRAAVIGVHT